MDKYMCQEIADEQEREQILRDSCTQIECMGYSKSLTQDEQEELKDQMLENCILLRETEIEREEAMREYNKTIKNLKKKNESVTTLLKNKSRFVEEDCYKFVDYEERKVGYYNGRGELISERPARATELQRTIFRDLKQSGTED